MNDEQSNEADGFDEHVGSDQGVGDDEALAGGGLF